MTAAVVDENVPIVANDATRALAGLAPVASQISDENCRLGAVEFLKALISSGLVVIDDDGICVRRYRSKLSASGQPGTGDAFLKHVFENSYNSAKVERISLTVTQGAFASFPVTRDLESFDQSDRIFVALALASANRPVIANAADSDYLQHAEALERAGVTVLQLCAVGGRSATARKAGRLRSRRAKSK